jgi:hypothetical protein
LNDVACCAFTEFVIEFVIEIVIAHKEEEEIVVVDTEIEYNLKVAYCFHILKKAALLVFGTSSAAVLQGRERFKP